MNLGSPVATMILFSALALCCVMLALPALKGPPPGFESKRCKSCNKFNNYRRTTCEDCETALEDPYHPEQSLTDNQEKKPSDDSPSKE